MYANLCASGIPRVMTGIVKGGGMVLSTGKRYGIG